MKYNKYTKQAPLVSEIGLGTWQIGVNSGWKPMEEKVAVQYGSKSFRIRGQFF